MDAETPGARLEAVTSVLLVVALGLTLLAFVWPSGAGGPAWATMSSPSAPVRVVAPRIGLDAQVRPVALSRDGVLDPPADTDVVGWWDGSARVGAGSGQVVLTGHTVRTGRGVLNRAGELRAGDRVRVRTAAGTMAYRVTRRTVWSRAELAARAEDAFGQDAAAGPRRGRLVLVTCTGWVDGVYTRNIVVFARPLGVRAPA